MDPHARKSAAGTAIMTSNGFDYARFVASHEPLSELRGVVTDVRGLLIEGSGPIVPIGGHVQIRSELHTIPAQVVGFRNEKILLMPFGEVHGIAPGSVITAAESISQVRVSERLQGRVIDALGNPMDGRPLPVMHSVRPLYCAPPNPVTRTRISQCLDLGVRALNGMLTVGQGQRVAIMAGSGVGKSTLLGCLSGAVHPDYGVIECGDQAFDGLTPLEAFAAGIAIIYQHFQLIDDLTVADNIYLGAELRLGHFAINNFVSC
jgi:flagellar biosynthesis/type III secretory pathway ATPase